MRARRMASLLLSMILCITMMPISVFADETGGTTPTEPADTWENYATESFEGGSGTAEDPYQIASAEQLAKLAKDINSGIGDEAHRHWGKYFILTKNIDLSAHKWVPIGYMVTDQGRQFDGNFNGNNKRITGLYVKEERDDYSAGLFGAIGGRTIKNVIIENGYVEAKGQAGILVGNASQAYGSDKQFLNCTVSGTVHNSCSTENNGQSGGLVGYNSYGSYENCIADVAVNGGGKTGGFVGEDFSGKYVNCIAKGKVSGAWSVGGFAGILFFETTVDKCASYGNVDANNWNVGGFAGYVESNVQIKNSVSFSDVTSRVDGWEPRVGGFVGIIKKSEDENPDSTCTVSNSYVAGLITKSSATFAAGGFAGKNDGTSYADCAFDSEKNQQMKAIGGEGEGTAVDGVKAESTQLVLSRICKDYEGKHVLVKVVAKNATTTETGLKEHWKCENCGTLYADESGTKVTTSEEVVIPKISSGGHYVPTQRPEIQTNEGGKTELSNNGRTLTITPDEGKEVEKVLVNGEDRGAVTEITGLRTGDKVEIFFKDKAPTKEELDAAAKDILKNASRRITIWRTSKKSIRITAVGDLSELIEKGYVVKYTFYKKVPGADKYTAVKTTENNKYNYTKLKKGINKFQVKIRIYDKDGNFVASGWTYYRAAKTKA